jgi:hypothetical protein
MRFPITSAIHHPQGLNLVHPMLHPLSEHTGWIITANGILLLLSVDSQVLFVLELWQRIKCAASQWQAHHIPVVIVDDTGRFAYETGRHLD